ncbi:MAG: fused MFS/spermidine synthase [Solirubrobacteraceae bacterium]
MPRRRSEPLIVASAGELIVERDRDRPSGRLLRQGDMESSYVDLADAGHLEFDYMRRMRDLVEAIRARRIVHVGGAGCALPRALAVGGADRRQVVAEVDVDVLALARAHLGLRRAPGLRVRHADGRALLAAEDEASADAILIDAFVGARVPRHLATLEALHDAARVLAPRGALAINVVDAAPLPDARAIAAGLCEAFPTVAVIGGPGALRARRGGNVVLLAAHGSLPLERLRVRAAADPSPAALLAPGQVRQFCGGATPWRDRQDDRD